MRNFLKFVFCLVLCCSCGSFIQIASFLNAKEIHELLSQETVFYARFHQLKGKRELFSQLLPVLRFQESSFFLEYLESEDYQNLQKGLNYIQWLFEEPPEAVFDLFLGEELILTLIPKAEGQGFYGLFITKVKDPEKAKHHLDTFYRHILKGKGILRREIASHSPVRLIQYQNAEKPDEIFSSTFVEDYLILANDENLMWQTLNRFRDVGAVSFLQNPLLEKTLEPLSSEAMFTAFLNLEKILQHYPQWFQKKRVEDIRNIQKIPQLFEAEFLDWFRSVEAIGMSLNLEKEQIRASVVLSRKEQKAPSVLAEELSPISRHLSPQTLGILNIRHLNHSLGFLFKQTQIRQALEKMSGLFAGQDFIQEVLAQLGEEITLSVLPPPKAFEVHDSLPRLPVLQLAISGRSPQRTLVPLMNSLNTLITVASFEEKKNPFRLHACVHEGVIVQYLESDAFKILQDQFSPAYTLLEDRLFVSSSLPALKQHISHFHQAQHWSPESHPLFRHLYGFPQNFFTPSEPQNLFAPQAGSVLSLNTIQLAQLLQENRPFLQAQEKERSAQAEKEFELLQWILKAFENFTLTYETKNNLSQLQALLRFQNS
jgi:hypothetical protein